MASILAGWTGTLDCKIYRHEPWLDPVSNQFPGAAIFVFWHEYMLVPCCLRRGTKLVLLASRSKDADWLIALGKAFEYDAVRGSSTRGGTQAVLKIVKQLKGKSLVITPDGPLGPRRVVSNGCIYLSSLLGLPIVPLACGYDRPWRIQNAWDKFAFPRVGSRVRMIMAKSILVPKKVDKDGVEEYRLMLENDLLNATYEAEEWAHSGSTKAGEQPMFPAKLASLQL